MTVPPPDLAPIVIRLAPHTTPADLPALDALPPRGSRVLRCDRWSYNERVVEHLRILHTRMVKAYGVGLMDPTGILGVDSSTTHTPEQRATRVVTQAAPIGANHPGTYQKQARKNAQRIRTKFGE